MKRVGYITNKDGRRITLLEAMGDYGNVQKAYNKARKCKRHRKDVLIFTKDKEENLDKVREDIINLAYEPSKYHYFKVYEPKERQIMALPFYDRVVQHAINNVLEPIFDNPYVYNTSAHTWDEFKRKISGQAETPQGGNEKTIWNFLTGKGLNAYAVAGIMGNLYAESGLMPNNLQNTYNNKLGKTDAEYTAAVDNGSYGNFVKDSAGYGLAQWTYWSRKQALLNHAKQAGVSIADLNMQLGFLWEELQGYTAVMDALKKAGSVRAASDAVLTGYEKPADQSETVKKKRAEYGEGYYKKYAAGNGTKYYRVRKSWTDAASQLGAFTSLENAKSACKAGYTVYDDNGKAVYTAAGQQASAGVPFSVQVDILDLNIRTGAGTNYAKTGETTGKGVFTIVEVKAGQGASVGWGRLKSGAGWISLDYATRLA